MEGLPPFTAGAVGYCAYDIVRRLEILESTPPTTSTSPIAC
jgi:anthranilate/para-aminobenzoate synthase component I